MPGQSFGGQVPYPSGLADPAEYGPVAVHLVSTQMLHAEIIRLDRPIRMASRREIVKCSVRTTFASSWFGLRSTELRGKSRLTRHTYWHKIYYWHR